MEPEDPRCTSTHQELTPMTFVSTFRGMLALMGSVVMREFDAVSKLVPRITKSSFGVGRHFDQASRDAFYRGIGAQGVRSFHAYVADARNFQIYEQVDSALTGPFRILPMVTIFGGRNDPLGFQPRWKKLFPNVEQIIVPNGNHFPMCDAPNLVANTIRRLHS